MSWFPLQYNPRVDTWFMYHATCSTDVSVTGLYVQPIICLKLSSLHIQ